MGTVGPCVSIMMVVGFSIADFIVLCFFLSFDKFPRDIVTSYVMNTRFRSTDLVFNKLAKSCQPVFSHSGSFRDLLNYLSESFSLST